MSKYNPEVHHRKSIRLKDYDYSKEGMYFITICTKNRECILSQIEYNNVGAGFHACPENIKVIMLPIGKEIKNTIDYINNNYYNTKINNYIIMPNHIHMIININNHTGRAWKPAPTTNCWTIKIIYNQKIQ